MKFSAPKEVLLKGIQVVQPAINLKSTLPILSNILVEAEEEGVVFTTTNLDIGITSTISIKPTTTGAITIPAKKFLDIIKEMPDKETILISLKKNNLITIECEKNIFKIMGLPKEEFPQLPNPKQKDCMVIEQKKLKKMLAMTSFAVSHDETRYVLNGILFVIKPTYLRLVATDGRRLAMIEEKIQLPKTLERKVIVPAKTINELDRVLTEEGDIKISFSENQVFFNAGATRVISRLIEGDFPSYEQVIPKEAKDKAALQRGAFLAGIKRVALFTNPESLAVKIELARGKMVLSKSTPYLGEAEVELEVDYKGKDLVVGFNPEYLIDILKNTDQETVHFELVDAEKPGVVRVADQYVYVVLPMQLG